jgi:hypothetical protein
VGSVNPGIPTVIAVVTAPNPRSINKGVDRKNDRQFKELAILVFS